MTTRAPERGLRFLEASHRYRLDGEWVPGVTTILGVLEKPAIPKWAAKAVAEWVAENPDALDTLRDIGRNAVVSTLKDIPWSQRDAAAARGTLFHEYAERIVNGEEVDVPEAQVPLVESCLRFFEDYNITPTLAEPVVGSRKHRYAGKADLIANGAIWDYKSGKAVYPRTALQLVAYGFAEFHGEDGNEQPMPPIERAFGVHIREDGYSVIPLKFGPDVFEEFLVIRRAYEVNKRVEGDWRTPGSGYAGIPLRREESA